MSRILLSMDKFERHLQDQEADIVTRRVHSQEEKQRKGITPEHMANAARELMGNTSEIRAYLKDPFTRKPNSAASNFFGKLREFWQEHSKDPMDPLGDKAFALTRMFMDILRPEDMQSRKEIEAEAEEHSREILSGTLGNARNLQKAVQQAIKRCREWAGEPVTIQPSFDQRSSDWLMEPVDDFYVKVGGGHMPAGFTVFTEKGHVRQVEDVLDAGDREFFHDPEVEMNYFDLVRELEHPGSTSKPGKNLTLWTARPTKDRHLYDGAKHIPTNIFLTTDMHRASGIAHDLGSNEIRDVWKMTINEKYLMQTLAAGRIKDYQTIGKKQVPVVRTSLVFQGESMDFQQAGEALGKLCEEMGLEPFDESKAVMHWVKQKYGAAKAMAHRAFVKMVRKNPAAHRQKMRSDKRYHRLHKWHDKLMQKTRRPGWSRRHLRAHVEPFGGLTVLDEMVHKGNILLMGGMKFRALSSSDRAVELEGLPGRSGQSKGHEGHKFTLYLKGYGGSRKYTLTPATSKGVPGLMGSDGKLGFKDGDVTVMRGEGVELGERDPGQAFMDVPFELRVTSGGTSEAASPDSMQIQTLIFSKTKFNRGSAMKWAVNHDFTASKVDEKANTLRIRQRDPDDFADATFRTITLTNGVKAVVAKQ